VPTPGRETSTFRYRWLHQHLQRINWLFVGEAWRRRHKRLSDLSAAGRFPVDFGVNSGFPAGFHHGIAVDATDDVAYGFFFPTGAFGAAGLYAAANGDRRFDLFGSDGNQRAERPRALFLGAALVGLGGLILKKSL
jgi:hypothetical protein